jgi:hypothetical protein
LTRRLRKEGFYDMVASEWNSVKLGSTPREVWQNKKRHQPSFLRGWAKILSSQYRKEKIKIASGY